MDAGDRATQEQLPSETRRVFDGLTPECLSAHACDALDRGEADGKLACADISLWEIAMLIAKGRLDPGIDAETFCRLLLEARGVRVLPVTPEIALASTLIDLPHADPADRLIAATAQSMDAPLLTCDEKLRRSAAVNTLW